MEKNLTIGISSEKHYENLSQIFVEGCINVFLPLFASALFFSFICLFSDGFLDAVEVSKGFLLGIIFAVMSEFMLSVKPSNGILEQVKLIATAATMLFFFAVMAIAVMEREAIINVFLRIIEIIAGEDFLSRYIDYEILPDQIFRVEFLAPFALTHFIYGVFRARMVTF